MQQDNTFTSFEGYSIITTVLLFHVFSGSLPQLSKVCGPAAWIPLLISGGLATGLFFFYYALFRMHEKKDLLEINRQVLGTFFAKIIDVFLFVYLFLFCASNLVEGVDLLVHNTYNNSRSIHLTLAFLLVVLVVTLYPIKGLARATSISMPVFMLSILFILIMAYNHYEPAYLTPILGYGWKPIAQMSYKQLTCYDGILILAIFMGSFDSLKTFKRNSLFAVFTACLAFFLSAFFYNMAVPYQATKYNTSGLLDLAQSIYINRFFQRFESVFIIFVSVGKILTICIGFMALKKVFSSIFVIPQQHQKTISFPLVLLVLAGAQVLYNIHNLAALVGDFMRAGSLYFTLGLLALLLIVSLIRGGKGRTKLKTASVFLACLLCGTCLSGCNMTVEPDEEVYTVIMGYDKSDSETLRITMKIMPEDRAAAGAEGGSDLGGDGKSDYPDNVFVVDAPCNIPAADLINTVIPKHISLLHVKMLVVSEELAREDIDMMVTPIIRYNEIKSSIALIICQGRAEDFIASKSSDLIPSLPMETEMILKQKKGNTSYLVRTMGDVYNTYISNYGDGLVMYAGINKPADLEDVDKRIEHEVVDRLADEVVDFARGDDAPPGSRDLLEDGHVPWDDAPTPFVDQNPEDLLTDRYEQKDVFYDEPQVGYLAGYLPGEIPIKTNVEQQIAGMAVLRGPQMVGTLNTHETTMFMIADGSFNGAVIAVRDPYKENYYVMFHAQSRQKNRVKTHIDEDGKAHIDIEAFMHADLAIVHNTAVDYREKGESDMLQDYTKAYLEDEIKTIVDKTQQVFDSDILRLGRYVAPHFLTIQEWEEYNWRDRYKDAEINVTVNLKL